LAEYGVTVEHDRAREWSVHLTAGNGCVGYVTDLGHGFEAIDVLPPYRVTITPSLEDAIAEILNTIDSENEPILAAYTGAHRPRE
jgi:hypothetical protein